MKVLVKQKRSSSYPRVPKKKHEGIVLQSANTTIASAIKRKLDGLPKEETKCYIYRVHDHLRKLNPSAYQPHILAIGPYHRDKGNTELMEKHKLLYLKSLLQRKNQNVDSYAGDIKEIVEEIKQKALSCYADSNYSTRPAEFIEMVLLDGCFIIELLLRKDEDRNSTQGDPIFETEWMLSSLQRDLMLFENQIPFFVLCKLYSLVDGSVSNYQTLLNLILKFFESIIPGAGFRIPINTRMPNTDSIKHLLHLIHIFWSPDSSYTSHQKPVGEKPWRFVSAVTKLRNANVKFEKNGEEGASLFDVTFENGTLKLSHLQIEDGTEDLFRNLIAYEQYFPKREQHNFATDYVTFLDCLIDVPQDVEILRKQGIVDNWLGTDEVVSNIFIKLTDSITIRDNFIYAGVCDDMNKHCKERCNNWMAKLRRNHLSSPWTILSVIAAVVLLLLTTVQTFCSVLQL